MSSTKVYSPQCLVCQYMRQHKAFSEAVILSTYFDSNGAESLADVVKRFNDPFPMVNVYQHCTRHMKGKISRWRKLFKLEEKSAAMKKAERAKELIADTMEVVEAPSLSSAGQHEQALDEFIAKGREQISNMPITATTLIQAIKAKAEIENKTKDRRFEAMKTLFSGMGPKDEAVQDVPQIPSEG